MSIESLMPSNHLILCRPLLLPSIFPSIRVFAMSQLFASGCQSTGASASASVLPMSIQGWFPLRLTGLTSLLSTILLFRKKKNELVLQRMLWMTQKRKGLCQKLILLLQSTGVQTSQRQCLGTFPLSQPTYKRVLRVGASWRLSLNKTMLWTPVLCP